MHSTGGWWQQNWALGPSEHRALCDCTARGHRGSWLRRSVHGERMPLGLKPEPGEGSKTFSLQAPSLHPDPISHILANLMSSEERGRLWSAGPLSHPRPYCSQTLTGNVPIWVTVFWGWGFPFGFVCKYFLLDANLLQGILSASWSGYM